MTFVWPVIGAIVGFVINLIIVLNMSDHRSFGKVLQKLVFGGVVALIIGIIGGNIVFSGIAAVVASLGVLMLF